MTEILSSFSTTVPQAGPREGVRLAEVGEDAPRLHREWQRVIPPEGAALDGLGPRLAHERDCPPQRRVGQQGENHLHYLLGELAEVVVVVRGFPTTICAQLLHFGPLEMLFQYVQVYSLTVTPSEMTIAAAKEYIL